MKHQLLSGKAADRISDCLVIGIWEKGQLATETDLLDHSLQALVKQVIKSGDFKGKAGDTLLIHNPASDGPRRVLLTGLGDPTKCNARTWRKAACASIQALNRTKARNAVTTLADVAIQERDAAWALTQLVQESGNAQYRYSETKSQKPDPVTLKKISYPVPEGMKRPAATAALRLGESVSLGMSTARELGNLPGNICTPSYLASQASALATRHPSVKVKILNEKQMEKLGMGSLLSVGHGSREESRLIVIEYKGAKKANSKPYCLVGKGITFDTGGISLKPGGGMDEMKFDMCDAASVVGTMTAVAELALPINVVAVIAAAENMPSSTATKPGDVVTSMAGKTIEILNTDAEGRLVLCDALTYAERFKPRTVIDIATLTGAAVATFGDVNTALLGNDKPLADELYDLGQQVLDPVWELPMSDEYQSLLDSNFADIANIGGPKAGTITAACFLSRFTDKFRWAHLDIAGTAWNSGAQKGATGRPVPLLVEYLRNQQA